ncbi:MAG: rhodanese-like domain-containing protein, partial [Desulfitobacterium hafniense]|nr:rhodanese-like domain-containing protein [Desulfitobacterium hafniense]
MNQNIMIAILLLVVLVLWTFMQYLSNRGIVSISPSDAKKRLDTEKGIILLDVRTKEEYIEKHLPKSIL